MRELNSYVCENCQIDSVNNNAKPPCEDNSTGFCYLTRKLPSDELHPLECSEAVHFVARSHDEIASISPREVRTKTLGKETTTYYLPTLGNLNIYFENMDWNTSPIKKQELFQLLVIYHNAYKSELF